MDSSLLPLTFLLVYFRWQNYMYLSSTPHSFHILYMGKASFQLVGIQLPHTYPRSLRTILLAICNNAVH